MIGDHYRLLKGLRVTADGAGIVSYAGVTLVRAMSDKIGLTAGLSKALASDRLLVHDRGPGDRGLDERGEVRERRAVMPAPAAAAPTAAAGSKKRTSPS